MESDWELPSPSLLVRTKDVKQDRAAIEDLGGELVEALARPRRRDDAGGIHRRTDRDALRARTRPRREGLERHDAHKDIAYAMASPDVRILAPIPGRSAIGVEVPNRQRTLVALGDLLASEEAANATHPLDVPLGRDISGKTLIANLGEMPHVLISGATGAGKSSLINSIVTALVMRATPDRLRLMLVDPKRVEMGQYNDLPHLLAPVVVDPKKAAGMLAWAVKEMERRYDILAESGARDITSYQQMIARGELEPETTDDERVAEIFERTTGLESDVERPAGPEDLPYIVIVVDELNDLMMVAARDVEESVVRIAQMARAVGHPPRARHATTRASTSSPASSRPTSRVASPSRSRRSPTVASSSTRPARNGLSARATCCSSPRRRTSRDASRRRGSPRARSSAWSRRGARRAGAARTSSRSTCRRAAAARSGGGSSDDDDEILAQARELIIRTQSGSTSMLQRKLRVGFARAGRIMDQLEQEGVVAAGDGSKARKVLVTAEEYDEQTSL